MRHFETNDPGVRQAILMFSLPNWVRRLYAWFLRAILRDPVYASLVEDWQEKTIAEYYGLIAQREAYRKRWFDWWTQEQLDFVITVPNALPAVPHGGMKYGWRACGYSFLFNLVSGHSSSSHTRFIESPKLDYTAGVLPITHVNSEVDKLSSTLKARNAIEKGAYAMYDAQKMHGLPVGVQVVGRRLEEEKVLEGMKIIEGLLKREGKGYTLLDVAAL